MYKANHTGNHDTKYTGKKTDNRLKAAGKKEYNPIAEKSKSTVAKNMDTVQVIKPKTDSVSKTIETPKQPWETFPPAPLVLKARENTLVRKIEAEAGEIKIEVYDNAEIDGDTVSIYHNNALIRSRMLLSQKPISIAIRIDPSRPHHELIMVAENLGSIPPNTSVMIITTAGKRYELFISSSKQKNAKIVFELKK